MTGGFDLGQELAAGVGDRAGAWRFIRRFVDRHASPVAAGDGCADDEVRAAETRLGFPLPAALREAYGLIGRRDDLTRVQDRLLAPDQLRVDDDGEVLVFRMENQNVVQWGVPLGTVSEPDPPVVFGLQSRPSAKREWRPFLDRVSLAWVEMVLSEWMWSAESCHDNREIDDDAIAAVERRFRRLPMPDYPMWTEPNGRPVRWFSGADAVLRDDAGMWLWVRAATAEGMAAVRRALPGDWLMVDDG